MKANPRGDPRRRKFVRNTALLTGSTLLMHLIGMSFQVWLAGRIGTAGIGLYQLTLSVTGLCATFAISGIRFAATRLVAEELGRKNTDAVGAALGCCLRYAALFGSAAAAVLWLLAEPLGVSWIGDGRTVLSLRIAAFSMPCIALCSAFSGYFTACGRVWKPTLVHLIEQLTGVALVAFFLSRAPLSDLERSCAAVTLGCTAADVLSCLLMGLCCLHDRLCHYGRRGNRSRLTDRMLTIALPLAVSAYARSALSTVQHLLVPRGLRAAGYSTDGALSGYGIIQGMVLPVLFFPSGLLAAAAELIVPELTEAQVRGDRAEIQNTAGGLLRLSVGFSLAVSVFLFLFADPLGTVLYKSADAGHYIRLLAPLVPVLYTDMAVDGCLKGLGQQVWCMIINIIDALAGLLLVWQLLPRYGLRAYIGILCFTEILNFALSVGRLITVRRSSLEAAAQR